ncbi:undecaprenyl-phosphate glucose phosphotransferase [Parabacteroides pacaensis]|uniref:undecaprenyl-phosphate glucose phosphotransferase n=1 Tax=Parabacteroides pacaensis TaxID=2086575 RepID=UPI000D0F7964|nr:undecaprenyl-phosphate glucose phosphotransferase [Parabacteroides pacaensis]
MSRNTEYKSLFRPIIMFGDICVINLLLILVFFSMERSNTLFLSLNTRVVFVLLNLTYFFTTHIVALHLYQRFIKIERVIERAFFFSLIHSFLFVVSLRLIGIEHISLYFLLVFCSVYIIIFCLWRLTLRVLIKYYRKKGYNHINIVFVGCEPRSVELYQIMNGNLSYGFNILGFFDDKPLSLKDPGAYLGKVSAVTNYLDTHPVDEVYCALSSEKIAEVRNILAYTEKNMIHCYIIPEFFHDLKKHWIYRMFDSVPVLALRNEPLQSATNRFFKRSFDVLFSSCILFTFFPFLYIVVGTLIKLSSPGPVFFKQRRTGLYGEEFDCYKFRSMKINKEADTKQAEKNDPRKTRIGDFLRKSSLDEFPQFINVLKGEMSVVGPRPHMLKHTEIYSKQIEKYMVRHLVKPGITGYAQVTGFRGETKTLEQMEGRIKQDVWYIENWSMLLDLKIILHTFLNVFRQEENAF